MNYNDNIISIIDGLDFPDDLNKNKEIIKYRFLEEVKYYENKRKKTGKYYNVFRFIVTTGSILLPAILSIGQMDPEKLPKHFDRITYWSSWSISLLVTICNGFLQLFSLDKNYFSYSLVVEQLKTEGWQYFGLSGKYEDYEKHDKKSYKEFCKAVENIKRKQIEFEFQGKGNDTKKKNKGDNTDDTINYKKYDKKYDKKDDKKDNKESALLDFDFEKKMKKMMMDSNNSEIFKSMSNSINKLSSVDNLVDNLKDKVIDDTTDAVTNSITSVVTNVVSDTIEDKLNSSTEKISTETIPNKDIESN
tara:strand:+ start:942 stop:1853 length:912 start_codon:yes stop_codon:yes gene_type:complete